MIIATILDSINRYDHQLYNINHLGFLTDQHNTIFRVPRHTHQSSFMVSPNFNGAMVLSTNRILNAQWKAYITLW